ncbi:hypothetical protein B0H13DRAFT_1905558 [Mycena leptocephala]|nr:hypothetical protein B0H13DRAFT_1905558 [Mycena leptocephala]
MHLIDNTAIRWLRQESHLFTPGMAVMLQRRIIGRDYLRQKDIIEEPGAIPGIPDYLAHSLLQQVAFEREITWLACVYSLTAIFDSCNSGGIGRKKQNGRFFESTWPISTMAGRFTESLVHALYSSSLPLLLRPLRSTFSKYVVYISFDSEATFLQNPEGGCMFDASDGICATRLSIGYSTGLRIDQALGHGLDRAPFKPNFVSSESVEKC